MRRYLFVNFMLLIASFHTVKVQSDTQIEIIRQIRNVMDQHLEKNAHKVFVINKMDSIIQHNKISESSFVDYINGVGNYYHEQGRLTEAVELYLKVVSYYEQKGMNLSEDETNSLIQLYIPLGAANQELDLWTQAMGFYFKALALANGHQYDKYRARIYTNIGNVYFERKEINIAYKYYMKSLAINKAINNKIELAYNYNNIAAIYSSLKQLNKTLDYALQAVQQLDPNKNAYFYYSLQTNIGEVYMQKKDYAMSMAYLNNAMVHQQKFGFNSDLMETYLELSSLFREIGNSDSSFTYLKRASLLSSRLKNASMGRKIQKLMADYYASKSDYPKAYQALSKYILLNDSVNQYNDDRKMSDMNKVYGVYKKSHDNEMLLNDITLKKEKAEKKWIITAVFAFSFGLIIIIMIYRLRNLKQERQTQLLLENNKEKSLEKEKFYHVKMMNELSGILDQRNRELTSYSLNVMKNNQMMEEISEEIKHLMIVLSAKDRKEYKNTIQSIQTKLQMHNSMNGFNEFKYYFEQVHPSFYKNLEEKCPDLTIKEKRLCAFLRLGLSTKDIASITFTEVRSVESARNRLRKKLDVASEESLIEFLSQNFKV